MKQTLPPETLSATAAAATLGVHKQTLYSMVRSGLLPVVRLPSGRARSGLSNRLRFRRSDLERLLDAWTEREPA